MQWSCVDDKELFVFSWLNAIFLFATIPDCDKCNQTEISESTAGHVCTGSLLESYWCVLLQLLPSTWDECAECLDQWTMCRAAGAGWVRHVRGACQRSGAAWRGRRAGGGDNTLLLFYVLLLLRAQMKAGGTWHGLASSSLNYLYKLGVSFTELLAWHSEQHTPHKLSSEHKYLPEYFSDNPTTRRRQGRQRRYQLCLLLL